MQSKYPGVCRDCGARIARNETIAYHGRGMGVSCAECAGASRSDEDETAGLERGTLASDRRLARNGLTVVRTSDGQALATLAGAVKTRRAVAAARSNLRQPMKTRTVKTYTARELKAQFPDGFARALDGYRSSLQEIPWQDETIDSLKELLGFAGIKLGRYSLGAYNRDNGIRVDFPGEDGDAVGELSGFKTLFS